MRNTGPDTRTLNALRERDPYCRRCGRPADSTQHRIKRGAGGTHNPVVNSLPALVRLCGSGTTGCHGWTEAEVAEAYATGWAIRRSDTRPPEEIPLIDLEGREFFLTVEGWVQYSLPGFYPDDTNPPF